MAQTCAVIAISTAIVSLFRHVSKNITDKMTFMPSKIEQINMDSLVEHFGNHMKTGFIKNNDVNISYALYNKTKTPKWSDNIMFVCHGNGGWMMDSLYSPFINKLSDKYTIFMFDYRGYGLSSKIKPSEKGLYEDTRNAWDFVTSRHPDVNTILPFGYSLGSSIVSHLMKDLYIDKNPIPRDLILLAPFYSAKEISSDIVGVLGRLNPHSFATNKYLKQISDKINIIIFHSVEDEIINVRHSKMLINDNSCEFIPIRGSHNICRLTRSAHDRLNQLI